MHIYYSKSGHYIEGQFMTLPSHSHFLSVCLFSVSFFISLYICRSQNFSFCQSVCLCFSIFVCFYLSVGLSLTLCQSVGFRTSLSLYLCLCACVSCLSLHSLSLSVCLSFCVSISVAYIYILDTYRRNDNRRMINDRRTNKGRKRKTQEWRTQEDFFTNILPLTLFVRFACERVLKTEHKLHILTPLLWPSRCVFLVLLDAQPEVLGSTPSGLFRGPPQSGVAFPTLSGLYCLEVCWRLLWHPKLNCVKW